MQFDPYGRPIQPTADVAPPTLAQLGGPPQQPWVRAPFFPTAPLYSTNPYVGSQIRFYSCGILSSDTDVAVGAETIRTIPFDIPARVITITGSCVNTAQAGALPVGVDPRDCFLFRVQYVSGDKLHIDARLGSTVVGTGQRPLELGNSGYNIDQGGALVVGITPINPIPAAFRIDITFHCLEIRGSSNFTGGGR